MRIAKNIALIHEFFKTIGRKIRGKTIEVFSFHLIDYNTDYQARRLNTRVRRTSNDTEFVHMNDATVFAVGRTIIAILENNQQADGTVLIPTVLQKWMGKDKIVKRS